MKYMARPLGALYMMTNSSLAGTVGDERLDRALDEGRAPRQLDLDGVLPGVGGGGFIAGREDGKRAMGEVQAGGGDSPWREITIDHLCADALGFGAGDADHGAGGSVRVACIGR